MMRHPLIWLALSLGIGLGAQQRLPVDSTRLAGAEAMLVDDYKSAYILQNKDFSLSKYDSLGVRVGRVMLPVPFRILSVQNLLNIVLFSQNAQQLRFLDQNLNEKQRLMIPQSFGYVAAAYAEDPEQAWLLDVLSGTLVRYDFRSGSILKAYALSADPDGLLDMVVFGERVYLLYGDRLSVFSLKNDKIADVPLSNARRLRRENDRIYIICKKNIFRYMAPGAAAMVFEAPEAEFVDKNTAAFFALGGNKLYLYRPAKLQKETRE